MTKKPQAASMLPTDPVHVRVLPRDGIRIVLAPDAAERAALAQVCGVTHVHEFEAELLVRRWRAGGVSVTGRLSARLEQPCVITLAPVVQNIDEALDLTFLPEGSPLARAEQGGELILDPLGPDLPEVFAGDEIDLWAVAIEALVLAVDPFARAPGASLDQAWPQYGPAATDENHPFAALARRKPAE